jgi:hypothetical protein
MEPCQACAKCSSHLLENPQGNGLLIVFSHGNASASVAPLGRRSDRLNPAAWCDVAMLQTTHSSLPAIYVMTPVEQITRYALIAVGG